MSKHFKLLINITILFFLASCRYTPGSNLEGPANPRSRQNVSYLEQVKKKLSPLKYLDGSKAHLDNLKEAVKLPPSVSVNNKDVTVKVLWTSNPSNSKHLTINKFYNQGTVYFPTVADWRQEVSLTATIEIYTKKNGIDTNTESGQVTFELKIYPLNEGPKIGQTNYNSDKARKKAQKQSANPKDKATQEAQKALSAIENLYHYESRSELADLTNLKKNLYLPSKVDTSTASISWLSNNSYYIFVDKKAEKGFVYIPLDFLRMVTLTATATANYIGIDGNDKSIKLTKEYIIKIHPENYDPSSSDDDHNPTQAQLDAEAKAKNISDNLKLFYYDYPSHTEAVDKDNVLKNVYLPKRYNNDLSTKISWTSDSETLELAWDEGVLDRSEVNTYPFETMTLTATVIVSYNNGLSEIESQTSFLLNVYPVGNSPQEKEAERLAIEAADDLTSFYYDKDETQLVDTDDVLRNFILKQEGLHNSEITWEKISGGPSILVYKNYHYAYLYRSLIYSKEQFKLEATFTVTLSGLKASFKKQYAFTVYPNKQSPSEIETERAEAERVTKDLADNLKLYYSPSYTEVDINQVEEKLGDIFLFTKMRNFHGALSTVQIEWTTDPVNSPFFKVEDSFVNDLKYGIITHPINQMETIRLNAKLTKTYNSGANAYIENKVFFLKIHPLGQDDQDQDQDQDQGQDQDPAAQAASAAEFKKYVEDFKLEYIHNEALTFTKKETRVFATDRKDFFHYEFKPYKILKLPNKDLKNKVIEIIWDTPSAFLKIDRKTEEGTVSEVTELLSEESSIDLSVTFTRYKTKGDVNSGHRLFQEKIDSHTIHFALDLNAPRVDDQDLIDAVEDLKLFFSDQTPVGKNNADDQFFVNKDLYLPNEGLHGTQIKWRVPSPEDQGVILLGRRADDFTVPVKTDEANKLKGIVLIASLTKEAYVLQKEFIIEVKENLNPILPAITIENDNISNDMIRNNMKRYAHHYINEMGEFKLDKTKDTQAWKVGNWEVIIENLFKGQASRNSAQSEKEWFPRSKARVDWFIDHLIANGENPPLSLSKEEIDSAREVVLMAYHEYEKLYQKLHNKLYPVGSFASHKGYRSQETDPSIEATISYKDLQAYAKAEPTFKKYVDQVEASRSWKQAKALLNKIAGNDAQSNMGNHKVATALREAINAPVEDIYVHPDLLGRMKEVTIINLRNNLRITLVCIYNALVASKPDLNLAPFDWAIIEPQMPEDKGN